jgi:hypothetical protein
MLASSFGAGGSIGSARAPAGVVVELLVAAAFVLLGVRSLVRWMRKRFDARTPGETVLYSLHVTARVGMWFAFAGFFVGYALVDQPRTFRWYVMVPLTLAAIQFLTAVALGLGTAKPPNAGDDRRE